MAFGLSGWALANGPVFQGRAAARLRAHGTRQPRLRIGRAIIAIAALCALVSPRAGAQQGAPLGTAQLQVSGARLSIYRDSLTTDAAQTINVGEPARVRTCYGTGACGSAAAGSVLGHTSGSIDVARGQAARRRARRPDGQAAQCNDTTVRGGVIEHESATFDH